MNARLDVLEIVKVGPANRVLVDQNKLEAQAAIHVTCASRSKQKPRDKDPSHTRLAIS